MNRAEHATFNYLKFEIGDQIVGKAARGKYNFLKLLSIIPSTQQYYILVFFNPHSYIIVHAIILILAIYQNLHHPPLIIFNLAVSFIFSIL